MKAITLAEGGVQLADIDPPRPNPNQVLVRVRACGLNRSDLLTTQGQSFGHVGGAAKVIGGEFTGEVAEVGSDAEGFDVGDRVMCRGAAGWAEYAVANWRRTLPIPSADISYEQAATIGGATQTMHDAIVTNGRFAAGQTILFQGASSGQGLMGMQIARLKGARLVIGTSTDAGRRGRLAEFGADMALDSREEGWVDRVLDATDGDGVDVTIDMVSGDTVNPNMRATAVNGHVVNVGRLGGVTGEFDFDLHAERRIHYVGTTSRTRTIAESGEVARLAREDLWDAVAAGELTLPIDKVFALEDARAALDRMAANEHFGKIVWGSNLPLPPRNGVGQAMEASEGQAGRPETAARTDGMQPWVRRTWRFLAAAMTFCALLWNVDFLEWFGVALVEEQYYAFVMAFALAVVFLSVRLNRSENGRAPWYDIALAAISMGVLLYISANFLFLREFGLGKAPISRSGSARSRWSWSSKGSGVRPAM